MSLKKLILIIAGALGILGTFLPWYKVSLWGYSQSTGAFQMGALYIILAILFIICSAAVILLSALNEKQIKKMIKIKDTLKTTSVIGTASAVITAIALIAIQSESQGFGSVSWGIWLMILSSAAVIVLSMIKNENLDKTVGGEKKVAAPAKKSEAKAPAKQSEAKASPAKKSSK